MTLLEVQSYLTFIIPLAGSTLKAIFSVQANKNNLVSAQPKSFFETAITALLLLARSFL